MNSSSRREAPPPWPHAPVHQLGEAGTYFVTSGTYHKRHRFGSRQRLRFLHDALLSLAMEYRWRLEAWAVFSNHYHFVAHSPEEEDSAASLSRMLGHLHAESARFVNRIDDARGRRVGYNFRDTQLTFQKSYFARLGYVHQNAVKHGLVPVAHQYPWCSAGWFERTAEPAQIQTIYRFPIDGVKVYDEYEVYRG